MQKGRMVSVALGFLIASTIWLTGAQIKNDNTFNYNALLETAIEKGLVRVIVEMNVPDMEQLTSVSTNYKTGEAQKASVQYALDADLALDKAISQKRNEVLQQLNGTEYHVNRSYSTVPAIAISCTPEALQRLISASGVLRVLEDKAMPLPKTEQIIETSLAEPDKPMLNRSTEIVGANVAWSLGYAGQGWYVAVLDTGIYRNHDMFRSKNIVEQCYSLGEDEGYGGYGDCPNGRSEMSGLGAAAHYQLRFNHGTHVSGIAAGNDLGSHFGVAKDAGIIAVQVFSYFHSEDDVMSWSSDQLKGLEYIYLLRNTYNIAAVNMSLGGGYYTDFCNYSSLTNAIQNLKAVGIATVIASGNDANCDGISAPGCIQSAIAVNGTNKVDEEYYWGNWSNLMVSLMAPGQSINSAVTSSSSSYASYSGTSMATPHVTGAWAILKSFAGNLSVDEILKLFKDTGTMISSIHCPGNTPKPRINIGDALMTLFRVAPPVNASGTQQRNKTFLQVEFINVLSWQDNPLNANREIIHYRVYKLNDNQLSLLSEMPPTTHTYWHRGVGERVTTQYAFSTVDNKGEESPLNYYTLTL